MTILEHTSIAGSLKKISSTSGGEWAGACPWCGGRDRFRVWPDHPSGATGGRFLCRGCGRQGDGLAFLMEHDGLSYPEACARMGTTPTSRPMGKTRQVEPWTPKAATLPGESWTARAGLFVDRCAQTLADGGPGLDYAIGRGLTLDTCRNLQIGWNPADLYEDHEAWGLPPEMNDAGRPKRIWLPAGLVLPTIRDAQVGAVKIRRAAWTPEDKLPKYAAVAGSAATPFVLDRGECKPVIVVESELDAILVAQEARDLVCAIALRTAKGKPDAEAHELLKAASCNLCALDYDRAGAEGWPWWLKTYRTAKRWPPLSGKDVGDMIHTPGLIRAWIMAGLADDPEPASPCRASEAAPADLNNLNLKSARPSREACQGAPWPAKTSRLGASALRKTEGNRLGHKIIRRIHGRLTGAA